MFACLWKQHIFMVYFLWEEQYCQFLAITLNSATSIYTLYSARSKD